MVEPELEIGRYYLVPEKQSKRVVRCTGLDGEHIVVVEAEGAGEWTLPRDTFEQRLRGGYVQEVRPRWEPAGEEVPV